MNQSINVDEVINQIKKDKNVDSRSIAELFIDIIRPYNLMDSQAIHMFKQIKSHLKQQRNVVDLSNTSSHLALSN